VQYVKKLFDVKDSEVTYAVLSLDNANFESFLTLLTVMMGLSHRHGCTHN